MSGLFHTVAARHRASPKSPNRAVTPASAAIAARFGQPFGLAEKRELGLGFEEGFVDLFDDFVGDVERGG